MRTSPCVGDLVWYQTRNRYIPNNHVLDVSSTAHRLVIRMLTAKQQSQALYNILSIPSNDPHLSNDPHPSKMETAFRLSLTSSNNLSYILVALVSLICVVLLLFVGFALFRGLHRRLPDVESPTGAGHGAPTSSRVTSSHPWGPLPPTPSEPDNRGRQSIRQQASLKPQNAQSTNHPKPGNQQSVTSFQGRQQSPTLPRGDY